MDTEKGIKLYYVDLHQDDPKKATMRKLERFRMAKKISVREAGRCLVITPFSDRIFLAADSWEAQRSGIALIEGSWNRKDTLEKLRFRNTRRLPLLLAVNPVNYGKVGLLSSVEAAAAALFITGNRKQAEAILSKFSWGQTFISTNLQPLEEYSGCRDSESVEKAEKDFFG